MKTKRIIFWVIIIAGIVIIGFFVIREIEQNPYKRCGNKEWLEKMKDDETTDFYLLGSYFSLPCSLETFAEQGWSIPQECTDILGPKSYQLIPINKEGRYITAYILNDEEGYLAIERAKVVRITSSIVSKRVPSDANDIVIKRGINLQTPNWLMRILLSEVRGYQYRESIRRKTIRIIKKDVIRYEIKPYTNKASWNEIMINVVSDSELLQYNRN